MSATRPPKLIAMSPGRPRHAWCSVSHHSIHMAVATDRPITSRRDEPMKIVMSVHTASSP
jgi:hypothetical protein